MSMLRYCLKTLSSAIIAYTSHYAVNKFYNYACVPDGLYGYLHGFISTGSPVCQTSIQLLSMTQLSYSTTVMMILSRAAVDTITN